MSLEDQKTIIFSAAESGDVGCLEDLMSNESVRQECSSMLNDYKDDGGNNLLLVAARGGHEGFVLRLLELGAVVDMKNNQGQTALQIACEQGYDKVAQALLKTNANINSVDYQGNSVLHSAGQRGCDKVIEMLLDRGASKFINLLNRRGETALQNAFHLGNEKAAQVLLERGANIDLVKKMGNTALHMACGWGNDKMVKILLQRGANININMPNAKEETALHIACERGHVNIVRLLLKKGADMFCVDKSGKTALHRACQWSNDQVVEVLLSGENNKMKTKNEGETSLQVACEENHAGAMRVLVANDACWSDSYQMVKMLLDRDAKHLMNKSNLSREIPLLEVCKKGCVEVVEALMDCVDQTGNTILHYACRSGSLQIIKMLLDREAKQLINKSNVSKETPLHVACEKGCVEIVNALIEGGADLSCIDEEDNTVLHKACGMGNEYLALILLKRGNKICINRFNRANKTALHYACEQGLVRAVWYMLERGAHMYFVDSNGNTILHQSCLYWRDNWEIVEVLLDRISSQYISRKNYSGATAMHIACLGNSIPIVLKLLERGADINCVDGNSNTVLHLACLEGNHEMVQILLSRGSSQIINAKNNSGKTALDISFTYGKEKIPQLLLKTGANIDLDSGNNFTILHKACEWGNHELVEILFNRGGLKFIDKPNNEETPLQTAVEKKHAKVVKLLIDRGVNTDGVDEYDNTILNIAVWRSNPEIIMILLDKLSKTTVNKPNLKNMTPLHVACLKGDGEIVQAMIDKGADVDWVDDKGNTILHQACWGNSDEVIAILLDQGGSKHINIRNKFGETALNIAFKHYAMLNIRLIIILLERGADVDCVDCYSGDTILHKACRMGQTELIRILLFDYKAKVDLVNYEGEKAFHLISMDDFHLIEVFLSKVPSLVNSLDSKGFSFLHKASSKLSTESVKYLLIKRADVNQVTKDCGSTPLHLALKSSDRACDVVEILIDGGARVNIKDNNGDTPLHLLARKPFWVHSKGLQIILLKSVHPIHEKNKQNQTPYEMFRDLFLDFFVDDCLLELNKMNSFRICEGFYLRTVFSKDRNPTYLRNNLVLRSFDEFFQSPAAVVEFPLYIDLLRNTYDVSKCRLAHLKTAHQILLNMKNQWWDKLPIEVNDHVLEYLTNAELEQLVNSFKN